MQTWTRYTTAGDAGQDRPSDILELGPGNVVGLDRRLLGEVSGLRILELGTGAGQSAIALARLGAKVVAIDSDASQIELVRENADAAEVHVEAHHADLADLAFLHAESFDAVVSIHALAAVADLGRVFRQTHRLLKVDRPVVLTLPHPASLMVEPDQTHVVTSDYSSTEVLGEGPYLTYRHGIAHVFTQLHRSNFRVDVLVEPDGDGPHPASIVFRARKTGT